MFNSIRLRMAVTYLLLIAAVMLATGLILLNMLEKYYLSSAEENLERTGRLTAEFIASYLGDGADTVLLSNVAENFSRQINARIVIVSPQKTVVGDSLRVGGLLGTVMERKEVQEALEGGTGRSIQYSRLSDQWVLQVCIPVEKGDTSLGAVFLSSSLKPVYQTLTAVRRFLITSTLVSMVFAGGLVVLFAHHLTAPIKELTAAAQQMAEGKLDQRIPINSADEIGRLAQQFNIMAARVKEMNQRLTRFVGDVSHELRTPLASIHVCLQSLQNYELSAEERQEFLEDINHETQRLIYLVEDLLELTRRQEISDKREVLSLKALLEEVLELTRTRVERKGLKLFTEIPEGLPYLYISPEELKRVVFNLLDNAIKYTPDGGWLKLGVESGPEQVMVTVQDTGCGIPGEAIPYLFERFYRVDKARSRYLGGTGLGLAICKEIVERYGGSIGVLETREGVGSTFFFTLPVDPSIQQPVAEL
ncbi:MAG: cell wall metabolism sensor histidine kinase WalK [Firmicutes bacterium]|nr:cell wall metabolism sensor histidine kinase WalK [Bacillota bacterium]